MKNSRQALIQLAILVMLGAAVLLTTFLPRQAEDRKAVEPLEISVVLREADSTLWSTARLGMEQAAGELGVELRVLTLAQANDGEGQLAVLRREAEQKADALVVVPADPAQLGLALLQGELVCPVVSLESGLDGARQTVAPDNGELGRSLAQAVLDDGRGGPVLLVNPLPEGSGVSQRARSARQALEEAGVEVRAETQEDRLGELMGQDWAAVMVFEPALTERALALKESLGADVPLYGAGVTASVAAGLERGTVTAAAAWSDFAVGYLAVEGAAELARGTSRQPDPLPFFILRGEDIYEPKYQKLLFPVAS